MSSTFTAEDIPAHLREKFEALPPEMQQRMLSSMTRVRAQRIEAEARQKVEVPEPPEIDERDLVADQLFPSHGRYGSPLSPAQQRDVDAQLGYPDPDRQLDPRAHNQAVRMLTLAEAAEVLGVSTSTAFRMTRGGGLPAVRFFKTLRIRSDHAWAVRNRRAAGQALGKGWDMLPRQRGSAHHGVPIEEVAATLRVHPQTLWRWGRRYAAAADPDEPVTALPWRCSGRRNNAVIPEDVLASWGIPYDKSSLRLIRFTDVRRLTAEEKKLAAAVLRRTRKVVGPDEVRRTDKVRDAVSGLRLYTMVEASKVLALSVSGARKALAAAGIETQVLAGVARVRQDDLMHLLGVRSARVNRKLRPDFVPDYGPDPLLVPIEDAAVRMGVTVRTLRRRGAAGKIDLVTLSGKLWVRRHEVAAAEADVAQAQLAAAAEPVVEAPAASRGAALTSAHIETFTEWLAWRYPDIDTSTA
ncbi:helix-turn-helix domain-containing protein, partial [Mycolicibacterium sp.]|uniref:helix-turn-helix domain-containing protein n=1 Tax=Mycolicibacterium sp. TaxID=2320850 RepID=UPI00355F486D